MFFNFGLNWELIFNVLLGVFSLCGFCPTVINGRKNAVETWDVILLLWSMIHIAIPSVLSYFAFQEFFSHESDFAGFNNILMFSITFLTHFACAIESIVVRKNFEEIWLRFHTIDGLIGNMLPGYKTTVKTFYRQISRKIIVYIALTVSIELFIITHIFEAQNWRFMWFITIIPLMISRFRHLHHTLYIDMLSCRFRVIKRELKSIMKFTKLESNKLMAKNFMFYDGLFKKLSTIKSVYNTLWETSLLINRSFGVSQLANLLQNFIQLTCDLYMLYSFLYKNNMTYIIGKLATFNDGQSSII